MGDAAPSRKRRRSGADGLQQKKAPSSDASPYEEVLLDLTVSLLPSSTADVLGSIRRQLFRMLMKYSAEAEGVIVGFKDISFRRGHEHGRIFDDEPHIHYEIMAAALVFSPKVGLRLAGEVKEVAQTHVAVLVNGIFNASLHADELAKKYTFEGEPEDDGLGLGRWRLKADHAGPSPAELSKGDVVEFFVKGWQHARGILSIEGALSAAPESAGEAVVPPPQAADWRDAAGEAPLDGEPRKKKSKKQRAREKRLRAEQERGAAASGDA